MNLYWVTTPNGFEDWFAVAKSKKEAEEFHEAAEGFGPNYATAKKVCKIKKTLIEKYNLSEEDWPSHELLEKLGGNIVTDDNPRVVNFFGKIYKEGTFTEGIFFRDLGESSGVYIIKIQNTSDYKIGRTINIQRRLNEFGTGNPFNLKLVYFIETPHYLSLEKHLQDLFKNYRTKGEWFAFDEEKLSELEVILYYLNYKAPNDFKVYNIKNISKQGRVY